MRLFRHLGPNFILFIPLVIIGFFMAVGEGAVPGLDLINLSIFFVSFFLFIPSFLQSDRTEALTDLRKEGISDYLVFSSKFDGNKTGGEDAWAGIDTKSYRIAFYGTEQGLKNGKEVLKTMKSTARIIWLRPVTWSVFAVVIFVLNFVSYNTIIPVLDIKAVGNPDVYLLRQFVFYLPCILVFLCPILSFIFVKIRDEILYKCALRLAAEIEAEAAANVGTGKTWYHNICPNCGTRSTGTVKSCVNCGTSLVIREGDGNLNSISFM